MNDSNKLQTIATTELLTPEQACEFLNLKRSMLRSLVFKRNIPTIRIGRCLRFSKSDLIKWLREKGLTA